jgi:hypothetical protein
MRSFKRISFRSQSFFLVLAPKLAKKVLNAIREKSTRRRDYAEVRYERTKPSTMSARPKSARMMKQESTPSRL